MPEKELFSEHGACVMQVDGHLRFTRTTLHQRRGDTRNKKAVTKNGSFARDLCSIQ